MAVATKPDLSCIPRTHEVEGENRLVAQPVTYELFNTQINVIVESRSWTWWFMPIISTLKNLWPELGVVPYRPVSRAEAGGSLEFQNSRSHTEKPCLERKIKSKKRLSNFYLEWLYCFYNIKVPPPPIIWGPPTGSQEEAWYLL